MLRFCTVVDPNPEQELAVGFLVALCVSLFGRK
jgi:hypothetical protein